MIGYIYTAHELYFGGVCLISGLLVGASWQMWHDTKRRRR
jgi:hypothetical protein